MRPGPQLLFDERAGGRDYDTIYGDVVVGIIIRSWPGTVPEEVAMGLLRLTVPAALAAIFLPVIAIGQIDPDADGIGIYFDVGATVTSATVTVVPPPPVSMSAWLVATRVSMPGFVRHFEGVVEWDGVADAEVHPHMPTGWDMCWEMPVSNYDNICADIEPALLATGDAVVLKRYDILVWGDLASFRFHIRSFRLWLYPLVEIALHPSSGDWNLPVAVINGEAPVPVEATAWGSVKSLFR